MPPKVYKKGTIYKNPHSHCKQVECGDVTNEAISMLSNKDHHGNITLVLVPKPRWSCSPYFTVPSGVWCLLQRFGAKKGVANPGLHCRFSFWRISHVVTKQACTYDAPVKCCPTQDNVMVDVNVVIVFQIVDPEAFVYNLGAANFDEYLAGTVDESMRRLVRKQTVGTVYEMRGGTATGCTEEMINALNSYFEKFGVLFLENGVKIIDVELPEDLRSNLEQTTKTDKVMKRIKRQHEFEKEDITMNKNMEILKIDRKKQQVIVSEKGRKMKAEIDFQTRSVQAEEQGMQGRIEAEQNKEVELLKATAKLNRTKASLEAYRISEIARAEQAAEQKRVDAEIECEQKTFAGAVEEEKMICEAEATKHDAVAEEEGSRCLIAKREHELKMKERNIIGKLAEIGNFNLIGTQADKLISAVMTGSFDNGKSL